MIKVLMAAVLGLGIGIGVMVIVIVLAGTQTSGRSSVGIPQAAGPTVGAPTTTVPSPSTQQGPTGGATGGTPQGTDASQIFNAQGCGGCHTFAPAGSNGKVGPELTLAALQESATKAKQPLDQYVKTSIVNPNAYVVSGFSPGVMPTSFGSSLSSQQISALVSYLTQK